MIIESWRNQVINTAKEFVNIVWKPTDINIFHGYDEDGVLVNTPDISYISEKFKCGWWKPNEENHGVPYNWGGYCTIESFKIKIQDGLYAGNVPNTRENKISKYCTGVDCSGLVTSCWGLDKKQSTKSLLNYATKLDLIDYLLPGDILLLPGSHVMIFVNFNDNSKLTASIIDATRSIGKVAERTVVLSELINDGYAGYRMIK